MTKNSYIKGASIIAIGGIISKILGLFFKIPIGRILDEGIGYGLYYNSYNIYNFILTVSIIGMPVAISKMIAERASVKNYYGAYKVFKVCLLVLLIVGGLSSAFLYFGADWIIKISKWQQETYFAILGLALAPLFVSILSAIRGFFQGMQIMAPTAISQMIEAIVRVVFGIGLCWYLMINLGEAEAAGGASAGATFGALFSMLFIIFVFFIFRKDFLPKVRNSKKCFKRERTKDILYRLIQIAVPVTLAAAVVSLFGLINGFTYAPSLIKAGFEIENATGMYGDFGLAQTMVNVPLTFSSAMAITLVPAISESFAIKDMKSIRRKTQLGIRVIFILAFPCAIGLSVFSEPIFLLLFPKAVELGGPILKYLSFSAIFIMFSNTLQSILQGMDKFIVPVKNLLVGLAIKFILNYILIANPSINIFGLVISNIGAYLVVGVMNYYSLKKYIGIKLNILETVLKPLFASLVMGMIGYIIYTYIMSTLGNNVSVIIAIIICIFIYLLILILLKSLTEEELVLLPGGRKILPIYKKIIK